MILIEPNIPLLKRYIKLYYIHTASESDFYQRIIYYPNYTTTLNIYQHSQLSWTEYSRTHSFTPNPGFLSLLVAKFDRSREIITQGPLDKLSIVFHPLGLNYFLDVPLSSLISDHFSFFTHYGESYEALLIQLFKEPKLERKRDLLDQFFLKMYRPFAEERLIQAINYILTSEEPIRVSRLSDKLGISRKTLLRLFQKHLGYSVETYLSVVRFRKALIAYQESEEKPTLTEVAYTSQYYDQSDFIHQFKAKSGLSPGQLYAQLKTLKEGLFWSLPE